MENVDLNSVRDSLLNESVDAANGLIDQWFASQIADLKCALDAKAAALAAPEPQTLDGTMGAPVSMDIAVPVDGSVGMMEPMDAPMAAPAPAAPMAPPVAPVDFSEPSVEPAPVEPEAGEPAAPAEPEVEEAEEPEVDPAAEDAVEAISADLEQLKADFLELLAQAELPTDVLDGADAEEAEAEEDAEKEDDDSEAAADEEKEDDAEADADEDEKEDADEAVEEAVEVVEIDEDALALEEAYQLKTVSDKLQNVEGAQVGEAGKIPVQTKSPVVSKPAKSREGGEAVVNKGGEAKGFEMEKAPKVTDVKLKDGKPGNAKEEGKKVSKEGDKSAVLNKSQGAENTKSPVGSVKGFKK